MLYSTSVKNLQVAIGGSLAIVCLCALHPSRAALQDPEPPAEKKYRFPSITAMGDSKIVDDFLDMQMDLVVTVQGRELASKMSMRARETYTEEFLATVKGSPTVIRRKYTAHREAETGPDGMTKVKVTSLQGKTITIRIQGKKVSVTAEKGKLALEDVKKLQAKFADDDSPPFVPDRELIPGEEWTIPAEAVAKAFGGLDKGEVKGRFERVFAEGARSLAEFRLDLDLSGAGGGSPVPMSMKGTGNAFYDLKLKREVGIRFSGPVSLEGEVEQQGQKLRIVGSGLMDARQTVRWLKVAGKPVNAPAYPPPSPTLAPDPNRQTAR